MSYALYCPVCRPERFVGWTEEERIMWSWSSHGQHLSCMNSWHLTGEHSEPSRGALAKLNEAALEPVKSESMTPQEILAAARQITSDGQSAPAPVIRVWTLGSVKDHLIPTRAAFEQLEHALKQIPDGRDFDLIWDDSLRVTWVPGSVGTNVVCGPGVAFTKVDDKTVRVEVDPNYVRVKEAEAAEFERNWADFKPGDMK